MRQVSPVETQKFNFDLYYVDNRTAYLIPINNTQIIKALVELICVLGGPLKGREKAWSMEGHYRVPSLSQIQLSRGVPVRFRVSVSAA